MRMMSYTNKYKYETQYQMGIRDCHPSSDQKCTCEYGTEGAE